MITDSERSDVETDGLDGYLRYTFDPSIAMNCLCPFFFSQIRFFCCGGGMDGSVRSSEEPFTFFLYGPVRSWMNNRMGP